MLIKMFVLKSITQMFLHYVFPVRPTVIETAVYVNSIGPVDPINMVSQYKDRSTKINGRCSVNNL